MRSNEKDEVCHNFIVNIFTKSPHRGGVDSVQQCKGAKEVDVLGLISSTMWEDRNMTPFSDVSNKNVALKSSQAYLLL